MKNITLATIAGLAIITTAACDQGSDTSDATLSMQTRSLEAADSDTRWAFELQLDAPSVDDLEVVTRLSIPVDVTLEPKSQPNHSGLVANVDSFDSAAAVNVATAPSNLNKSAQVAQRPAAPSNGSEIVPPESTQTGTAQMDITVFVTLRDLLTNKAIVVEQIVLERAGQTQTAWLDIDNVFARCAADRCNAPFAVEITKVGGEDVTLTVAADLAATVESTSLDAAIHAVETN